MLVEFTEAFDASCSARLAGHGIPIFDFFLILKAEIFPRAIQKTFRMHHPSMTSRTHQMLPTIHNFKSKLKNNILRYYLSPVCNANKTDLAFSVLKCCTSKWEDIVQGPQICGCSGCEPGPLHFNFEQTRSLQVLKIILSPFSEFLVKMCNTCLSCFKSGSHLSERRGSWYTVTYTCYVQSFPPYNF